MQGFNPICWCLVINSIWDSPIFSPHSPRSLMLQTWNCSSVTDHLPSMCKALESILVAPRQTISKCWQETCILWACPWCVPSVPDSSHWKDPPKPTHCSWNPGPACIFELFLKYTFKFSRRLKCHWFWYLDYYWGWGFPLTRTQQWDKVNQTIADHRKGYAVGNDYVFKDLWEDRVGT